MTRVAIIGTAGVPAAYGGFETLAENLVRFHAVSQQPSDLVVYCSGKRGQGRPDRYLGAELQYVPVPANGILSTVYDAWSLLRECRRGADVLLILGVSGALVLPLVRLISNARIIVNVDGIEWRRPKWGMLARSFLRVLERIAVQQADSVIADNRGIAEYLREAYDCDARVIAYGGDHAVDVPECRPEGLDLPDVYALGICRIEPENNLDMILDAFCAEDSVSLVMIGNWGRSEYGRNLRHKYAGKKTIIMVDPIYDLAKLRYVRSRARFYVHGHSAGGTNPSLVEAMHFGAPIAAFDCSFNRYTMADSGSYFRDADGLKNLIPALSEGHLRHSGAPLLAHARKSYTWSAIGDQYFKLISPQHLC